MPAPLAMMVPPETPPSVASSSSVTTRAKAPAITRITMATKTLGRKAISPWMRSLMGFGPNIPKASCSTNRKTAQNTILARMSDGSYLDRANA
jgi:hypothetical protein